MARFIAALGSVALLCRAAFFQDDAISVDDSLDYKDDVDQSTVMSAKLRDTLDTVSDALLDPSLSGTVDVIAAADAAASQMDLLSASRLIARQLPQDMRSLVQKVEMQTDTNFNEEVLGRARKVLNELVEKSWIELDDKVFKCKGFQEMNRENFAQVTRDILRLIEGVNNLERLEAEAVEGAAGKETEIHDAEEQLAKETKLYNTEYRENESNLLMGMIPWDVMELILSTTKCAAANYQTTWLQTDMRVCNTRAGKKALMFTNKTVARKYKKMLTKNARKFLDSVLRDVEKSQVASMLQQPANQSTTPQPKPATPVKGEEGKECSVTDPCMTCGPDIPDPCLLHDKLSRKWGEYKDKIDELAAEMMRNQYMFEQLRSVLSDNIKMLTGSKAKFAELLAEARANLAADRTELKMKYQQKSKLNKQYYPYMSKCKRSINTILTMICGPKTVRNAVLENSTECPSAGIGDCVMDAWMPSQCSASCDNTCSPSQPFKCGGWQKMVRRAVVQPDACGIKCPVFEKYKRCGQFKCPIDCHMSMWGGWSKCTAECEGGLQSHTRAIRMTPEHGGEQCNTLEESRPCNTMSCDRDCTLKKWSKWSPCSVACGGGFAEQWRHVLIPTRGEGKCPKAKSKFRYDKQQCNTQECNGDEICIAQQDLVIAIDSSGSIQDEGFNSLKKYVSRLLTRYETEYFGLPAVKIGIVLFGNGVMFSDGDGIAPAINAQKLTFDMASVKNTVDNLPYKKGFVNMAQAFAMGMDMFMKGSRSGAQQAIMLVTGGKASFAFMASEMSDQLDEKAIQRYFFVVTEASLADDEFKQLKSWASQPWETNLMRVGGFTMLEADMNLWVEKAVTKFCPSAYSATSAEYYMQLHGYQHVKAQGWCGVKSQKNLLSDSVNDAAECAGLAAGAGWQSFMLGSFLRSGWCIGGTMDVSVDQYKEWMTKEGKTKPNCPLEDGWHSSTLFDFYALEPAEMKAGGDAAALATTE